MYMCIYNIYVIHDACSILSWACLCTNGHGKSVKINKFYLDSLRVISTLKNFSAIFKNVKLIIK